MMNFHNVIGSLGMRVWLFIAIAGLVGCAEQNCDGDDCAVAADDAPAFCSDIPRPGWAAYNKHAASGSWFDVYEIENDLFAITEPAQWQEVISYLIIGENQALLFDSGNGMGDIRAVVEQLTSLPVTALASHSHFDHVGGLWQFEKILAPDTAFTRKSAAGLANQVVREEASAAALCAPLPEGVTQANHHIKAFNPTGRVKDGTQIDLGGVILEVLATPGHTPDSIVLVNRQDGRLFTGDSYYKGPIWLFAPETDLVAYRATIARLAALAPSLNAVHGGHNEPFSHPNELIKVREGLDTVLAGNAKAKKISDGQARYEFDTFELVLQAGHEINP